MQSISNKLAISSESSLEARTMLAASLSEVAGPDSALEAPVGEQSAPEVESAGNQVKGDGYLTLFSNEVSPDIDHTGHDHGEGEHGEGENTETEQVLDEERVRRTRRPQESTVERAAAGVSDDVPEPAAGGSVGFGGLLNNADTPVDADTPVATGAPVAAGASTANFTTNDAGDTIFNSGEVTVRLPSQELAEAEFDDATREKVFGGFSDAVRWWDDRITQGELNVDVNIVDLPGSALASALFRPVSQDGVAEGLVNFDLAALNNRTQLQTQQTLAHEIGHVLSLEHLPSNTTNILTLGSSRNDAQAQARLDAGLTEEQAAAVGDYGLTERPDFTELAEVNVAENGSASFRSGNVSATLAANDDLDDATRERLANGIARGVAFWDEFVTEGSLSSEISFVDIAAEGAAIQADSGQGNGDRTGRIQIDAEEFSTLAGIQAEGFLVRTLGRNLGLANEVELDTVLGSFGPARSNALEVAFRAGPNAEQIDQLEQIGLREAQPLAQFEVADNGDTIFNSGEVTATLRSSETLDGLDSDVRDRLNRSIARSASIWDGAITEGSLNTIIRFTDIPAEGRALRGNFGSGTGSRTGNIEVDAAAFADISLAESERQFTRLFGANLGLRAAEGTITSTEAPERVVDQEALFAAGPSDEQLRALERIGLRGQSSGQPTVANSTDVEDVTGDEGAVTEQTA